MRNPALLALAACAGLLAAPLEARTTNETTIEVRADGSVWSGGEELEPGEGFAAAVQAVLAGTGAPVALVVDDVAPLASALAVLAAGQADGPGLRDMELEVSGPQGATFIVVPSVAEALPENAELTLVDSKVVVEGKKVDPTTGEPWSGSGPYVFEGREVIHSFRPASKGSGSSFGGYLTQPDDLSMLLPMIINKVPGFVAEFVGGDGVVWSDADWLLGHLHEAGLPVQFGG